MLIYRNNKYYQNDREITKEEYDKIISSLPKPTQPSQEEIEKELKISQLKEQLSHYDYIGVKIAMGVATKEQYAKEIAESEKIREQIRELDK